LVYERIIKSITILANYFMSRKSWWFYTWKQIFTNPFFWNW